MLTADSIRSELDRAFAGDHGTGCDCCEPFPDGCSALDRELLREARYAIGRYDRATGLIADDDARSADELDELARQAAGDALAAARGAIVARAVLVLARVPAPVEPVVLALDATAGPVACRAETFDGIERRRCTRPASFSRDGIEVCRQHARLPRIRIA
jgi:hypothetical protein